MKNRRPLQSSHLLAHDQRGFTLLELMVTVTILGVLLGLTVPSFKDAIQNNRLIAQNNEFVTSLTYARSEALRRADTVSLCPSSNGSTCVAAATNWSTGWITFTDVNGDGNLNGADLLLKTAPATTDQITINSTAATFIRYSSTGMLTGTTAASFKLLKTGCTGDHARKIDVSVTGRVSTVVDACS